jgi:hypothetical protein
MRAAWSANRFPPRFAKLFQFDEPPPDLASALEGFSPRPEMPEIAKAEALLSRLALGRFGPDFCPSRRPL